MRLEASIAKVRGPQEVITPYSGVGTNGFIHYRHFFYFTTCTRAEQMVITMFMHSMFSALTHFLSLVVIMRVDVDLAKLC